jgi:succinate dehydrogenase/fumarate reductase flavoprotein subunit
MAGTVYEVTVVGSGDAGLCAALAAQETDTRVFLLDKCPKSVRGGNTGNITGIFRFRPTAARFALRPMRVYHVVT